MLRTLFRPVVFAAIIALGALTPLVAQQATPEEFKQRVDGLFSTSCTPCHSAQSAAGGLNLNSFLVPSSIADHRDEWELILQKMESGEMPPPSMPRPEAADIEALATFVRSEFTKADALIKPDPGRVTARRLNRTEYTNTVRDLLDVEVDVTELLPADGGSYGFDNIAGVLGISPTLLERYLGAARKISRIAVGRPAPSAATETFRVPNDLSQDEWVDGWGAICDTDRSFGKEDELLNRISKKFWKRKNGNTNS